MIEIQEENKQPSKSIEAVDSVIDYNQQENFKLSNQELIAKKCIMNLKPNYSDETYTTYKCLECDTEPMCIECFYGCHSHGKEKHEIEETREGGEQRIVDHKCGCAVTNHSIIRRTTTKVEQDSTRTKGCQLSSKNYGSQASTLFFTCINENRTKSIVCFYCKAACFRIKKVKFTQCEESNFMEYQCSCQKDHKVKSKLKIDDRHVFKEAFLEHPNIRLLSKQLWENKDIRIIVFAKLEKLVTYIDKLFDENIQNKPSNNSIKISPNQRDFQLLSEFQFFLLWLKTLQKMEIKLLSDPDLAIHFNFNKILKFATAYAENKEFKHSDCLIYYIKCFKLIHCQEIKSMDLFGKSISSLHRIFFLKKRTEKVEATKENQNGNLIHYNKPLEEAIEDLLDQMQISIIKEQSSSDLLKEYFELLEYIIDLSHNNFPKIKSYMLKYTDKSTIKSIESKTKIKKILSTTQIYKTLVEKVSIYQNDYIFYAKLFKSFHCNKKDQEVNNNFCFENSEFNHHLLDLLLNYLSDNNQTCETDYKRLFDDMFNPNDYFIESLKQFEISKIDLNENINLILDNNDAEYITSFEVKLKFEEISNMIDKLSKEHDFKEKHEEIINTLLQIKDKINQVYEKNIEFNKFQFVFGTSGKLFALLNISNDINLSLRKERVVLDKIHNIWGIKNKKKLITKEITESSNKLIEEANARRENEKKYDKENEKIDLRYNAYEEIFYDIIQLICYNNPFITVLFFDQGSLINKRYAFLQLNNITSLKFYRQLLKVFRNTDYKINTEYFREEFALYSIEMKKSKTEKELREDLDKKLKNESNTNYKTILIDEFNSEIKDKISKDIEAKKELIIILLETARLMLAVSSPKSFVATCQFLSIEVYNIWKKFELNKSLKFDNLELLDSKVLLAYFSFVNKLNNDSFDLFKTTLEISKITAMLKENSINDTLTPQKSMLKAELILFYTKFHFSSLYTKDTQSLLQYSQIQMTMAMIDPVFDYFKNFAVSMHKDLTPREFIGFFVKGICIPSLLIIWKIASFATLDGIARYAIYNLTCWHLIHFKFLLEYLASLSISDDEKKILLKSYFVIPGQYKSFESIEEMQLLRDSINLNHSKITDEKFKSLDVKECMKLFFDTMNWFKFFSISQKNMKEMEKEDIAENEDQDDDDNNALLPEEKIPMNVKLQNMIVNYINKKKSLKDNILMEFFSENNATIDPQAVIIGNILLNSFINRKQEKTSNPNEENPLHIIHVFDMSRVPFLTIINKLFKQNPKEWQEIILDNNNSPHLISQLMNDIIRIFAQFTFADYSRIIVDQTQYYFLLMESIEFLRLLCEDHNPYFQTILIKSKNFFSNDYPFIELIFDISLEITKHVRHFTIHKDTIESYFTKEMYWNKLAEKLCDFQVEIVQGTRVENLQYLTKNDTFQNFIDSYYEFMDYCTEGKEYAHLSSKFLRFINCFFEEFLVYKHLDIKGDIDSVLEKLNPKKLVALAEKSFEKTFSDIKSKSSNSSNERNEGDQANTVIAKSENVLKKLYENYPIITSNPYFQNAFNIFLHITQMKDYKNEKFCQYDQIVTLLSTPTNIKSYAYYNFCSKLLNTNEVMYTLSHNQSTKEAERYCNAFNSAVITDAVLKNEFDNCMKSISSDCYVKIINRLKIYYLAERDSTLLQDSDYDSFKKVAVHDDYYSKLSGILQYYDEYSQMIDMRKRFINDKKPFLIKFNEFKYDLLETVNCYLCFIPNILLIFKRDPWDYYSYIIFYWEILQLVFLGLIIFNYVIFNLLKINLSNNAQEEQKKDNDDSVQEKSNIKQIFSSFYNKRILLFEWMFIWGLLGLRFDFLLSLQLFAIFTIYPTMRNVLFAIQTRYEQFLSTGFLLIILILFYSAITLYFFQNNQDAGITCTSYWECFLYLMNDGIRAGGVAFNPKIIEQPGYWSEFIYSWIFYFLIILIILNIINGIIVDTFQSLRENNNKELESINNICFICQLERSSFENKGLNYEDHLAKEHDVMGYFKYLFLLHRTDQHDLNAVNFQVYNAIKAGKVEFFPIEKANGLEEDDENDNDDENDENNENKDEKSDFGIKPSENSDSEDE